MPPLFTRRELLVAAGCAAVACGSGALSTLAANAGIVTLTFAQFPSLATAGGGVVVDVTDHYPIAVVRLSDSAAVAVLQGPANRPLSHFNATLTSDAILVDVG